MWLNPFQLGTIAWIIKKPALTYSFLGKSTVLTNVDTAFY